MSLSAQAASLLPQPDQWIPVNDSVMGGVSISEYRTSPDGDHRFSGRVSLENNGGFASVRSLVKLTPPFRNARLHLRVRGDGKRYQLRLRTDRGFDGVAYASAFTTQAGEVTTVSLGLGSFAPTWRGRQVRGAPPLSWDAVNQLSLMISDKQSGAFALDVLELSWTLEP